MSRHTDRCNCAECQINALRNQLPDRIRANNCGRCDACLSGLPKECTSPRAVHLTKVQPPPPPSPPSGCGMCGWCLAGQRGNCVVTQYFAGTLHKKGCECGNCTPPPPLKSQVDKQDGRAARSPLSKVRLDLIPVGPLVEVGRVFTFGALRYGDRNWEFGFSWMRCYGSILRHLWKWAMGATNDEESGCNHLAHVVANCLFLLEYAVTHREFDDRPINTGLDVLQYFQPIKNINDKE
jgi:hypothetical protein